MYTFIKLTVPPPSMIIFDASNRDECLVSRQKTNTPLQALVMMNDPTVLEASRVFAETLVKKNINPENTILTAFESIICRKPVKKEMDLLSNYYKDQLTLFNNKKELAEKTIRAGEYPYNHNSSNITEVAALMRVINLIYNMEEAIVRV